MSLEAVRAIAETGVDYVSACALTKHVRAIDLSMRLDFGGGYRRLLLVWLVSVPMVRHLLNCLTIRRASVEYGTARQELTALTIQIAPRSGTRLPRWYGASAARIASAAATRSAAG